MAYRDEDILRVTKDEVIEAFKKAGISDVKIQSWNDRFDGAPLLKSGNIGKTQVYFEKNFTEMRWYNCRNSLLIETFSDTSFRILYIDEILRSSNISKNRSSWTPIEYLQPIIRYLCPPIPIAIDSDGNEYDRAFFNNGGVTRDYRIPVLTSERG